ncbi:MAG: type II secretion system protein GspD, partial [Nitrospinota bacterium]
IIGGLIKEDLQDTVNKVPILGDIPILGWLFKSKSKQRVKTNLLVFLTPHIINRAEDLTSITEERKKLMEKLQKEEKNPEKETETQSRIFPANETRPADNMEPDYSYNQEIVLLGAPGAAEAVKMPMVESAQNVAKRTTDRMSPGR